MHVCSIRIILCFVGIEYMWDVLVRLEYGVCLGGCATI